MYGRPMVAPTTMLVRKLFDKPEFIPLFLHTYMKIQALYYEKKHCGIEADSGIYYKLWYIAKLVAEV